MKKILLILLVAILTFPLTTALSAEERQPEQSRDMLFARAMGIIDAEADPEGTLTRIGLAKIYYQIISNAVQPESGVQSRFLDVAGEEAGYADFAAQCGIMNGVSKTEFDAQGSVTYIQLLKTLVSFLGYDQRAKANGGYPYGYLMTAGDLGLIDKMTPSADSVITVSKAATAFRLATNVSVMKRVAYGSNEEYAVESGTTYLDMYMDTKRVRGVVTANYLVDFDGGELRYDQVKIDGELYGMDGACAELKDYLGYRLDVYVKDYRDGDLKSIIYYETADRNIVTVIDGGDMEGLSEGRILYREGDKNKKLALGANTKVVYNASLCGNYDESIINPFVGNMDGTVTALDNNGDDICDLVSVEAYDTYVVSDVVGNVIFNQYRPAEVVDLGGDYKEGDIEIINILNEPLPLADISEGDIISVSRDSSGLVRRITVTIDSYTGTVGSYSQEECLIGIDQMEFKMSRSLKLNPQFAGLRPGDKVTVYFNKDGKISDIEAKAHEKYKIGFLVDASTDNLNMAVEVKLFTSGETFEILPLAEKVTIRSLDKVVTAREALAAAGTAEGSQEVNRQPVLYKVNDKGEINWIDYCAGTDPVDGLFMYEGFDGKTPRSGAPYRRSVRSFGAKLLINDNTVIFSVPPEERRDVEEDYVIETSNLFSENDTSKLFEAYGDDKDSPCAKILVLKGLAKNDIDMYTDMFVVDRITDEIDDGGEAVKMVYGIVYGVQASYVADAETITDENGELPEKGDVLRLGITKKGKINYAEAVFDEKDRIITGGVNPSSPSYLNSVRYSYGEVVYFDGSFLKVKIESPGANPTIECYPVGGFKMVELDKTNGKKGTLQSAAKTRLFGSDNYPGYSSKVFIHTRNGDARTLVIYND